MSTTVTLTMAPTCSHCGTDLSTTSTQQIPLHAQRQIEELQEQVRLLTEKASAAAEKWADYEDEIQRLRAQSRAAIDPARSVTPPNISNDDAVEPASPSKSYYIPDRLSSFLSPRKSAVNVQAAQAATAQAATTPSTTELVAALTREQNLRQAAEKKLDGSSAELEELSAQLFTQANEMVATERKARAKLEQRVEVLEKRDVEKRTRLDKLEGALSRIDRVRGLLAPGGAKTVTEKETDKGVQA